MPGRPPPGSHDMNAAGNYGWRCSASASEDERTPTITSITKWLAVATTEKAIAIGIATANEAQRPMLCGAEHDDPDRQVPPGMEARHRRVLVDQIGGRICR